jgi:hypothetical protein
MGGRWSVSPPIERNKTRGNARLAITRAAEVPRKACEKPWAGRAVRGGNAGRANANAAGLARHKNKLST